MTEPDETPGRDERPAPASAPKPRTRAEAVAAQALTHAVFEPPSEDVATADEAPRLPGEHRGGFSRLPTEPLAITHEYAPETEPVVLWAPPEPRRPPLGLGGWALGFSIAALVMSFFVGWGFPLGLIGAITAIVALRRPAESRGVAVWALVLGVVSIAYSAGWLLWAASRANLLG